MPKFTPPSMPKLGGPIAEDRRMTLQAFNTLIQQMVPLSGDLCPQQGKMVDPFNNSVMPDLSCPGAKFGGKHSKRYKQKNTKTKKTNKTNNKSKKSNKNISKQKTCKH